MYSAIHSVREYKLWERRIAKEKYMEGSTKESEEPKTINAAKKILISLYKGKLDQTDSYGKSKLFFRYDGLDGQGSQIPPLVERMRAELGAIRLKRIIYSGSRYLRIAGCEFVTGHYRIEYQTVQETEESREFEYLVVFADKLAECIIINSRPVSSKYIKIVAANESVYFWK